LSIAAFASSAFTVLIPAFVFATISFTTGGGPAGAAVGAAGAVAVWANVRLTIDKINTNDNVQMSILFIFFTSFLFWIRN
jgi:hypothetical protein